MDGRMGWVTVYIKGRKGFQDEVLAKLEGTWLLGSSEAGNDLVMFWLPDLTLLRRLKMTIGSKLIFKHRLHFFTDLDNHLKLKSRYSSEFSRAEKAMVNKMISRDEHQRSIRERKVLKSSGHEVEV